MSPRVTELRLGGRNYVRTDDPVRVNGKQGLWRFVAANTDDDGNVVSVELVGPCHKPYNPRTRTFKVEQVRRVERSAENIAAVARR